MNTQISHFERDDPFQQTEDLDDRNIGEMQEEIEFLREQVESLKLQMFYAYEFARECYQELEYRNKELELMNAEISNLINSQILPIDEATELGKSILEKKKFTDESITELLSAIYRSPIQLNELVGRDKSSFDTELDTVKSQSEKIIAQSKKRATKSEKRAARSREIKQQIHQEKVSEGSSQYPAGARLPFRAIAH